MSKLQCPHCNALVDCADGWAKAALITLVAAPAVADMATQLRCPNCHEVFTQAQGGQRGGWRGLLPVIGLVVALLLVGLLGRR